MTSTVDQSPETASTVEATFRVMGTDAHIIVVDGPTGAIDSARARLEELEARWSRFRADSELCRLNARSGCPVVVSDLTFELLGHTCGWWARTAGAFDPTVLPALERAGYDRTFDEIVPVEHPEAPQQPAPSPGCAQVRLDPVVRSVTVPSGVRIDLGGIAKGFAADLVADDVLRSGAAGVCVNLGGDLRVAGRPPTGAASWVVAVDVPPGLEPHGHPVPMLSLADGAVATTSRALRTWRRGASTEHHVIDPRTGCPARTPWISATVITGRAVDAEPLAKAALLSSTPEAASTLLAAHGATGFLIDSDGLLRTFVGAGDYLVDPAC